MEYGNTSLPTAAGAAAAAAASQPTAFPSPTRQASYFATGALAGLSTVPIELGLQRVYSVKPPSPPTSFARSHGPTLAGRAGVRFWAFDLVKRQLQQHPATSWLPIWVQGGAGGFVGGLGEVCAESLVKGSVPTGRALAAQSSKLFFCFGSYTYLSTTLAEELPPRPFWYCWLLGAAAGGFGSGVVARVEGVKGSRLWQQAVLKGALVVGTVIAVQVTSCASLIHRLGV